MNYFGIRGVTSALSFFFLFIVREFTGTLLVNNVRIVYTYIRCSRVLGGQNTSAGLRKILADALQAPFRATIGRNNEAGLMYLRSR